MTSIFKGAGWIAKAAVTLTIGATLLSAQKPKSQKEVEGLMAIQNAATADAKMKATDDFLTKFADTEFKSIVLEIAANIDGRHAATPALVNQLVAVLEDSSQHISPYIGDGRSPVRRSGRSARNYTGRAPL